MTELVRTRAELAATRDRLTGGPDAILGLVPTMGALHAGHQALFDVARDQCAVVAASIFVNPMQFSQAEDLARYPRRLEEDLALCERHGVDLVWAPDVTEIYPDGPPQVWVTAGRSCRPAGGPEPSGPLRRGADRGHQAVHRGPARPGVLR